MSRGVADRANGRKHRQQRWKLQVLRLDLTAPNYVAGCRLDI